MTKTDTSKLKPSEKSKETRRGVPETKATERKRVEDALKASEQNFHNLLDSSFFGIRILDKNDNTLYANKALLDIFGYENMQEVKKVPRKNTIPRKLMPVGSCVKRNYYAANQCQVR